MTDVPPELAQSLASLSRRITDVRDFQIPRLESLSTGAIERHSELCSELRSDLDAVTRAVEVSKACTLLSLTEQALAELGEEQLSERDRLRSREVVADVQAQITR